MAKGPLRRLVPAEPQGPADPVQQPRPSPAPTSGLRRGPRGARALRQGGHPRPPRTAAPGEARARPRGPLWRLWPCSRVPSSALCPALTSLRPHVPWTQLRAARAGGWAVALGGGAPALRLFPTCARAAGAGPGGGGRARARGAGPGLRKARNAEAPRTCAGRWGLHSLGGRGGFPPGQNPVFRRRWCLPGAVLSFPDKAHDLGLH